MDEKMISLCISYPSLGDPDRQMLFRIADYYPNEDKMYQVQFDNPIYAESAKKIGFHPKDAYPYMTELREWEYDEEDSNKTWSFFYSSNIYEIVYPPELVDVEYSDATSIRKVLCDGFSLDESVSENILIAIGKHGTHNAVIQCRKKDLKKNAENRYSLSSDIRDMMHATHYLKEYDIVDAQIISTDNQYISTSNGKATTRYFYNSTTLPIEVGVFHPVDFNRYIPLFITSYIKKNKELSQFSSNDIRKISDLLEVLFADQKHREDFFACTRISSEKLEELLPQYKAQLSELLLNDTGIEAVIKHTLLEDEAVLSRCVETVRMDWLAEQNEEKTRILDELQSLRTEKQETIAIIEKRAEKKQELEVEISSINELLTAKKAELKKVQNDIEQELITFSNDIVHSTAVCAIARSFVADRSGDNKNSTDIIIATPIVDEHELLENRDDFQEALADNLMLIGYDEDVVDYIAQLITYSMSSYMPIILSGNEDDIAQCIAATMGTSVATLNICSNNKPTDYLEDLKSKVTNSAIILVNGAFSGMTVEHFNALRYHFSREGYIVLFSMDGADIEMIPKTVYEKSTFLDCHQKISFRNTTTLCGYKFDLEKLVPYFNETSVDVQLKQLAPFIERGIINKLLAISYAKFMAEIDCNLKKDWLVLLQICVYAKVTNKTDILVEVLNDMGLEFEELKYYL